MNSKRYLGIAIAAVVIVVGAVWYTNHQEYEVYKKARTNLCEGQAPPSDPKVVVVVFALLKNLPTNQYETLCKGEFDDSVRKLMDKYIP